MAGISGMEPVCLALSRELYSGLSWSPHPVAGRNRLGGLAGRMPGIADVRGLSTPMGSVSYHLEPSGDAERLYGQRHSDGYGRRY